MAQGTAPEAGGQYPAMLYRDALVAARDGGMPSFTPDQLVAMTGLAADEPDGLTIVNRFAGPHNDFGALRALSDALPETVELIDLTNEHRANPAQEAVAVALGAVVSRQIIREKNICPVAENLALASQREDIIDPQARAVLIAPYLALVEDLVERLAGPQSLYLPPAKPHLNVGSMGGEVFSVPKWRFCPRPW